MIIHGRNAVLEAVRAGRTRRVYIASGLGHDPRLDEIAKAGNVETVDRTRIDEMAPGVNQGVAAELKAKQQQDLRGLLATAPNLLIALDGVMDPHNLGAITRTAEASGAHGLILPARRSAHVTPTAVKASSGATEWLPIVTVPGIAGALPHIKRAGLWCVGLDPEGDQAPATFDFTSPVCLVVGGEGPGLHRLVRDRCDARVRLPMRGHVGSLNASAAVAMLLYEVMRQRG